MSRPAMLLPFLLLVLGGGTLIGLLSGPDEWYRALQKPDFNPPDWIFGPVWTVLYVMIAVAGWRTWDRERQGVPMRLWALQLVLNFAWTPAFFLAHQIGIAFAIVLALLMSIVAFTLVSWTRDRVSALLFLPYMAWTAFASVLNGAILSLN